MLVIALCTACFSCAKINKKLWPSYVKIWLLYFECSGAGTVDAKDLHCSRFRNNRFLACWSWLRVVL